MQRIRKLVGADGANNIANTHGASIGNMMLGHVASDGIIERAGHLAGIKLKSDGYYEIATFGSGIKQTLAVGEVKIGFGENFVVVLNNVVHFDLGERIGDFLTIGADILHRGGTSEAGDFAQSFDTGEPSFAGVGYDIVPVFTTHDFDG